MSSDKELFKKGLAQLREEGYKPVPLDQQINNTNTPVVNDFLSKMAGKWKQVTAITEAKDQQNMPPPMQQRKTQQQVQAPASSRAATMDLPRGISASPSYIDESFTGAVDPREDDDYFERMQQEKLQAYRNKATTQQMPPQAQPIREQYTQQQVQPIYQQPVYQPSAAPLNEDKVAQVAETVLKDVVLNMYIEEKIRKVLSEGLSDDRIKQVVKQTIKELTEYNKSKK